MNFAGKTVLVTGAAGNLGQAVATAFHDARANVVLIGRDMGALRDAFGDTGERRLLCPADLLDEHSIANVVETARHTFGAIDVLCNIAGAFASGPAVHETPASLWQRMIDANATTVINTAKAVVPGMIERRSGNIINVGAAASTRGQPNMAAYAAAKNAVVRLTESMAIELRPHGVCVCCVMPTTIDTPQNRDAMPRADTSQWTPPAAIADVILFLASHRAFIASGCAIALTGRPRTQ